MSWKSDKGDQGDKGDRGEAVEKPSDKDHTLDSALAQIEKSYGKGAIMRLGDAPATRNIEVIPTGALTLDLALGVGGIPRGRVIEIYGPESSGKTCLLYTSDAADE